MKSKITFVLALAAMVVLVAGSAWATEYYVDPLGTDDGSHGTGTGTDAWATIQYAIDNVSDGDVINLAAGTYTEQLTIDGKGLTITGESESGVIVQAAASQTGSNTFSIGYTTSCAGKDITIEKMTIRHGDYGIHSKSGNVNVLHCTFYHNGWDGAGLPDPDNDPQSDFGIFWWSSGHVTDGGAVRIENSAGSEVAYNTVYENDRGLRYQYGSNGNFHHNSSYNNIQSGIYLTDHGDPGGCTNTRVHDNTVYGNMNNGILVLRGNSNTITNNNVYDNWNTGIHMHGPSDFTVEVNTVTNNSLYAFNGEGNAGNSDGGIAAAGDEKIAATAHTLEILDNTVSNNNAGSHANSTGIWLGTGLPGDGIFVDGNTFTGHELDVHVLSQAATTVVNNNNFDGSGTGVRNDDASAVLDAECNWWGSGSGPSHASNTYTNPAGDPHGSAVSDNVDFVPWLEKAAPKGHKGHKGPKGKCFAPVALNHVKDYLTIQAAIDAAADGDKIEVEKGKHYGAIVDREVEIKGKKGAVINDGPLYGVGPKKFGFKLYYAACSGTKINGLTFEDLEFPIFAYLADDITIDKNTLKMSMQGITMWHCNGWTVKKNTLDGLYASGGGGIGIFIGCVTGSPPDANNNIVEDNKIKAHFETPPPDYSVGGLCLYSDHRWGAPGGNIKGNLIKKNKVDVTGAPNTNACELTDQSTLVNDVTDNTFENNDLKKSTVPWEFNPAEVMSNNFFVKNKPQPAGFIPKLTSTLSPRPFGPEEGEGLPKELADGESSESLTPETYALYQNYPNPFNPETAIRFQLREANHVMVKIFNTFGQEVRTLVEGQYEAGYHDVQWDGKDNYGNTVSSGVYLYMLQAGTFTRIKKMSLLR